MNYLYRGHHGKLDYRAHHGPHTQNPSTPQVLSDRLYDAPGIYILFYLHFKVHSYCKGRFLHETATWDF